MTQKPTIGKIEQLTRALPDGQPSNCGEEGYPDRMTIDYHHGAQNAAILAKLIEMDNSLQDIYAKLDRMETANNEMRKLWDTRLESIGQKFMDQNMAIGRLYRLQATIGEMVASICDHLQVTEPPKPRIILPREAEELPKKEPDE